MKYNQPATPAEAREQQEQRDRARLNKLREKRPKVLRRALDATLQIHSALILNGYTDGDEVLEKLFKLRGAMLSDLKALEPSA